MKPLISIIIPVYNGENEIESAVRSAVEERLSMEILVVDDGSKDATRERVLSLAKEIPFLRLITQENSGPAAARNRGIDEAKGDAIAFLDSDDAFCPDALFQGLKDAEGKDLTVFGYVLEENGKGTAYVSEETELSSPEIWREKLPLMYRLNLINQVWAKIFSAALLKEDHIRFPHCMWGEDRLFLFEALEKAKKVSVSSVLLCRYIQRKGSLVSRFLENKGEICLEIDKAIRLLAEKKGAVSKEGEKVFRYMYLKSLLSSFATLFSPHCPLSLREKRRYVKKALEQKKLPSIDCYPKDCGVAFRVLALVCATGLPLLNLFFAWGVFSASRVLPGFFRKAKHAYNKEEPCQTNSCEKTKR